MRYSPNASVREGGERESATQRLRARCFQADPVRQSSQEPSRDCPQLEEFVLALQSRGKIKRCSARAAAPRHWPCPSRWPESEVPSTNLDVLLHAGRARVPKLRNREGSDLADRDRLDGRLEADRGASRGESVGEDEADGDGPKAGVGTLKVPRGIDRMRGPT
jgi:hypothetical protein